MTSSMYSSPQGAFVPGTFTPRPGAGAPGRMLAVQAGTELRVALRNGEQVLLTLLVGVVGFGGMFAVYSYVAPLVTDVTGMSRATIPLVLLAFGIGGVVGTALGGRLADLALFRSLVGANVATGLLLGGLAGSMVWFGKVLANSTPPSCQRCSSASIRACSSSSQISWGWLTCGLPAELAHDVARRAE